jgi:hypothetical protein
MHPLHEDKMTGVAYMVERLSQHEQRGGAHVSQARQAVARRIGIPPGTVENIQRNRLKFVERVEAKVRAAFIRLLEHEIAKATHELAIARAASDRVDTPAVFAADAALAQARKLLEGVK